MENIRLHTKFLSKAHGCQHTNECIEIFKTRNIETGSDLLI